MAFDPLDCGKNLAQKALDAAEEALAKAKADLKAAVDLPDTEFGEKLAALKAKASAKLDALNLTIPEIPKIPNFQEEIDKIIAKAKAEGADILQDLQKLEDSWKDIVPLEEIQELADKIKNPVMKFVNGLPIPDFDKTIDICKDVKKQDAEIETDAEGNVTLKEKQTPPVAKSPDETVKPDPKEKPQPAPTEKIPVIEPDEEPTGEEVKTPSEYSLVQARDAKRALLKAEKAILQKITDAEEAALAKITFKKTKGNGESEISKLRKKIPEAFKKQYKDQTLEFDYYCSDEYTGSVPSTLNKQILRVSKMAAYAAMKKAIKGLHARIINTLTGNPTKDGKARWSHGKWDPRFERDLRAALYYDQGFGIREYHPNYGFGLRDRFKTKATADKVKSAFDLKIRDYTAAFTPRYQDGNAVKNGTYTGEPDTQFSNLIKDYVQAFYAVTIEFGDFNPLTSNPIAPAWLVLVSHVLDISGDEVFRDDGYPRDKDFLPTSLGGNLPPYEDYIDGMIAEQGATAEGSKYSESTFEPHYMFKFIPEQNVILSKLAEKYEEHLQFAKEGYVHDSKGI